jgi:hypothetical protein
MVVKDKYLISYIFFDRLKNNQSVARLGNGGFYAVKTTLIHRLIHRFCGKLAKCLL